METQPGGLLSAPRAQDPCSKAVQRKRAVRGLEGRVKGEEPQGLT